MRRGVLLFVLVNIALSHSGSSLMPTEAQRINIGI